MAQLTKREREIVQLLMQGKQPKDIRQDLCIESSTMRMHTAGGSDLPARLAAVSSTESEAPSM